MLLKNSDIYGEPTLSPYVQQQSENKQMNFSPSSSLSALKSLNSDHFVMVAKLESITNGSGTEKYNIIVQGLKSITLYFRDYYTSLTFTGSGIITKKFKRKFNTK